MVIFFFLLCSVHFSAVNVFCFKKWFLIGRPFQRHGIALKHAFTM